MSILNHDPRAVKPQRTTSHTALYGNPITVAGKTSGFYMERTREYYRKVEGSRHFLRKPPKPEPEAQPTLFDVPAERRNGGY